MTTREVAERYYELAQAHRRDQIVAELYGENMTSREPDHAGKLGLPVFLEGLAAVKAKLAARAAIIEAVHEETCSAPAVGGAYFSVGLMRDLTLKGKPRMTLSEVAVFEVRDGKIVSEQFFY
ncbi:MAG TPA: SnoaL-like domain-containing protein [Kofleriaceae bacterium]